MDAGGILCIRGWLTYKRSPRLEKSVINLQSIQSYDERTEASVDSNEFLWDQKKHLQGTGASTSQVNCISLVPLLRRSSNSIPFLGTKVFCSPSGLIKELLFALGVA